jgi:hypothetical protein
MTTTAIPQVAPTLRGHRVRRVTLVVGALVAVAVTLVGILPMLATIAVVGLLLAGIAGPSQGPDVQTVTASRRTTVAVLGIVAGFAVLVLGPTVALRMVQHVSLDTVELFSTVLGTLTLAVLAAPLAMSEERATGPGSRVLTRRDLVLAVTGLMLLVDGHMGGASYLVAAAVTLVPLGLIAVRLRNRRRGEVRVRRLGATVEIAFWLLLAGTTMLGTFDILSGGSGASTVRLLVAVLCALGVIAALIPTRRTLVATTVVTGTAALFLASQLAGALHAPADASTLPSPVRGEWYVVQGGRAELINAHRSAQVQDDAFDILQVSGGATHRGDPKRLESYFCYGEPVLAPVAGRVASVVSNLPDQRIGSVDVLNTAGNNVVLDIGGGRYVAFGHLRAGSVTVAVGDVVQAGQKLGEVGNSGNSDEPHLHLQVQNVPGFDVITPPEGARTYPWLFPNLTVTRSGHVTHPAAADLRRGDVFTS